MSDIARDLRAEGNSQQGLAQAAGRNPEVILLDLGLPKLSGLEVCRRIRKEPWGKTMVLIALTGWGQEDDKRRTREAGFDGHLVKPVDPDALLKFLSGPAFA